jgi:DNA-binding IclR family transcriptional regulator
MARCPRHGLANRPSTRFNLVEPSVSRTPTSARSAGSTRPKPPAPRLDGDAGRVRGRREAQARKVVEPNGPNYVRRTLDAMERLAVRPLSVEQLAASMAVHPRTAVRMLRVMEQEGWVERVPGDPARFVLTPKILGTAGSLLGGMNLVQASAPFVVALREELDETSHIAVPSQGFAIQIYEERSSQSLAVTIPLGSRVPLHASAIGKVLAAHLPSLLDEALKQGLTRYTPNTITTRNALEHELEMTRARGFAIDDEEINPGTRCVAAPVHDPFGAVIAALGASGPHIRMSRDRMEVVTAAVTRQARALSIALGWRPVPNADPS